MMKSSRVTVAVTGLGGAQGATGVAVLRDLAATAPPDERRVGLASAALDEGIYATDVVDDAFVLPPVADTASFLRRLRELRGRHAIDALIPTTAEDVRALAGKQLELRALGISTMLPTVAELALVEPAALAEVARASHIEVPRTVVVSSAKQIARLHEELAYPLVLRNRSVTAGAATHDELCVAFQRVASSGLPAIAQERPFGEPIFVVGVADGQGDLVAAVAVKFLMNEGPNAWVAVTVSAPSALAIAARWASGTRWRGAFELRVEVTRGRAVLRSVEAHIPPWIHVATAAGVHLPRAVAQLALGQPVDCAREYATGVMLVRGTADRVVSSREYTEASALGEVVRPRKSVAPRAVTRSSERPRAFVSPISARCTAE